MDTITPLQLNFTPYRYVTVVDVNICGDILRVVMTGCPTLKATTATQALQELRDEHDDFRNFIIAPPRGHEYVNACLLLPPFSKEAVHTLVVAADFGYAAVAGTLLMAATTALIETQQIKLNKSTTNVIFDTAQGKQKVIARVENGRCISVRWITNKPDIVLPKTKLILEDGRILPISVIHSGLPYLVVRAVDLDINMNDHKTMGIIGAMLSYLANLQLPWQHNKMKQGSNHFLVMIIGELQIINHHLSVDVAWVSPTGSVAFSPAGTGALSVLAYFYAMGQLTLATPLTTISPTGCQFDCQLDEKTAYVETCGQIVALSELIQA